MSNTRPQYKHGKRVRTAGSNRIWIILTAVVVVVGIALVIAVTTGSKSAKPATSAPPALVRKVTSIPESVFAQVKTGSATATPKPIDAPALTANGKPLILYVGAEYCPYCAAERWPMVIALSRFGSFGNLGLTHSSSDDVFPDTATFSFHGATYTSQWITFTGVETESNQRQGDGYAPLDKLTPEQEQIFATYNAPPYTESAGGIPFINFGGRFLVGGASYDPDVLSGKSADDIASALGDPASPISKGAVGTANTFTAAICSLTNDQPAAVCNSPTIKEIAASWS